jgi:hypothetical protein
MLCFVALWNTLYSAICPSIILIDSNLIDLKYALHQFLCTQYFWSEVSVEHVVAFDQSKINF